MDNSRYRNRDLNEAAAAAGAAFGTVTDDKRAPSGWDWRLLTVTVIAVGITATLLAYVVS